jgi:pimeloyl-ACP methyl ester carboxylesterase
MKIVIRLAWLLFLVLCLIAGVFYFDPLWVNDQLTAFHLWRQGVHGGYVTADGHRLHYLEAQPPGGSPGIPLVLIHGLGDRAESWSPQIHALAVAGFHVYAPDLLGYGRSDRPDITCSIPVETAAVTAFLQALNIGHADVAGWSMGGWIATEVALEHPELVDRLVLEDSAGIRFQATFARNLFTPTDEAGLHRLMAMLSPHPRAMPPFVARAALRQLQRNARVTQGSMDSMESGADLLDNRLGAIQQPTLILWGDQDQLIPIATGLEMHREIPNSVFATVTGCGHLAPSECARPVVNATIEFLKATQPMPRGEITLSGYPSSPPRQIPRTTAR